MMVFLRGQEEYFRNTVTGFRLETVVSESFLKQGGTAEYDVKKLIWKELISERTCNTRP